MDKWGIPLLFLGVLAVAFFGYRSYPTKFSSVPNVPLTWQECVNSKGAIIQQTNPQTCVMTDGRRVSETTSSGIKGKMFIGPIKPSCGVNESCERPYKGLVIVKSADNSREVARVSAEDNGDFKIPLPAGSYLLNSDGGGKPPFLKAQTVNVEKDKFLEVNLNFDSGIR